MIQDLRDQLQELSQERERLQELYNEARATCSPRYLDLGIRLDRVTEDMNGLSREIEQALSEMSEGFDENDAAADAADFPADDDHPEEYADMPFQDGEA